MMFEVVAMECIGYNEYQTVVYRRDIDSAERADELAADFRAQGIHAFVRFADEDGRI